MCITYEYTYIHIYIYIYLYTYTYACTYLYILLRKTKTCLFTSFIHPCVSLLRIRRVAPGNCELKLFIGWLCIDIVWIFEHRGFHWLNLTIG